MVLAEEVEKGPPTSAPVGNLQFGALEKHQHSQNVRVAWPWNFRMFSQSVFEFHNPRPHPRRDSSSVRVLRACLVDEPGLQRAVCTNEGLKRLSHIAIHTHRLRLCTQPKRFPKEGSQHCVRFKVLVAQCDFHIGCGCRVEFP